VSERDRNISMERKGSSSNLLYNLSYDILYWRLETLHKGKTQFLRYKKYKEKMREAKDVGRNKLHNEDKWINFQRPSFF
jgi:hypothetical protein